MEQLLNLKKKIDAKKSQRDQLLGQKSMLEKSLKEAGFKTIKEAKKKLEEMEIELDEMETEFEKSFNEFEEKYKDLL